MIFFIAPYTKQFLGASRKIELLLGLLTKIDTDVVLINSWIDDDNVNSFLEIVVDGKPIQIRQYFLPARSKNRLVYSMINYVELSSLRKRIIKDLGKPDRVWLYNCYFLETQLALTFKKHYNCKLILELEDSCFARSRGFNPKPYLDNRAWKSVIKKIDFAFAVNQTLAEEIKKHQKRVDLLPGLISSELVRITNSQNNLPFNDSKSRIKLGYFGGLYVEKGAKMLIDLFNTLPDYFEFIITGTGELEDEIKQLSIANPNRFRYYGRVSNEQLINFIAEADIFLNPHQPMSEMDNGVFPFKIMEAIASKRMIISTSLAGNDVFGDALKGIVFLDNKIEVWKQTIIDAKKLYIDRKNIIFEASDIAIAMFSEEAVVKKINAYIA